MFDFHICFSVVIVVYLLGYFAGSYEQREIYKKHKAKELYIEDEEKWGLLSDKTKLFLKYVY